MPIHRSKLGPNIAPIMPVLITITAVSEAFPPIRSLIPIATGVVTDLVMRDAKLMAWIFKVSAKTATEVKLTRVAAQILSIRGVARAFSLALSL